MTMISRFEQFSSAISSIYKYIQKIEREEMAKYGLKGPQVQCLMALERHPDGLTAARLCELCEKDKAAISRTLAQMEENGLVCRENSGYRAAICLTDKGCNAAHHISGVVEAAVELAGKGLADEDRKVFYAALNLISANLRVISEQGLPTADLQSDWAENEEGDSL